MLRQNGLAVLALIAAISIGVLHFLKKSAKIGYVETQVMLTEFTEAVEARKEFAEAQKEWDKNLKMLNDSLNSAMESLKQGYEKASPSRKEELKSVLQRCNEDLQRYTNAVRKMSQDKEKELMDPVIKKVNSFLDQWGSEHGYDMILGTLSGGNILQASKGMNLTQEVLKGINEQYKNLPNAEALTPLQTGSKGTDSVGASAPSHIVKGSEVR